jgi:hypothetical protein
MPATKGWAFLSEYGGRRVSAYKVKALRDDVAGRPLGITFWSNHHLGERRRMKHVLRKNSVPFFAYIDEPPIGGDDGGVSLSHRLYQEAIAQLSITELRLDNFGDHRIRILSSRLEKTFRFSTGPRRVDLHCRFTSSSILAKKWGHEVCIEVRRTHAVPRDKIEDFRRERIAVIEVPLPQAFEFPHDESITTEELEAKHLTFLTHYLGKFIVGKVLSDPSSAEYLEEELIKTRQELVEARERLGSQETELVSLSQTAADYKGQNAVLIEELSRANHELVSAQKQLASQETQLTLLAQAVAKYKDRSTTLSVDLQEANNKITDLNLDAFYAQQQAEFSAIEASRIINSLKNQLLVRTKFFMITSIVLALGISLQIGSVFFR